jgi:hypothetical protein
LATATAASLRTSAGSGVGGCARSRIIVRASIRIGIVVAAITYQERVKGACAIRLRIFCGEDGKMLTVAIMIRVRVACGTSIVAAAPVIALSVK